MGDEPQDRYLDVKFQPEECGAYSLPKADGSHEEYCPRCVLLFEIARDPGKAYSIVLPPHDRRCPTIAAMRPKRLRPFSAT